MVVNIRSVLISDAVDPLCINLLKSHGINVVCKYKLPKDQLIHELQTQDGLIVRSDTKVTKDVINSAPGLRVIGRAGTGVDNIDLDAATKRGIIVINTPGGNSISACEMTCALISCLARNIPQACQSLKEGRWDRKMYTGSELHGKILAILGLGRIGREVATRMQSYGMKTIGFDPIITSEQAMEFHVEKKELEEIWPVADYITVHTPLIPQTKNLINEKTLNKSKKGVCIINVARGGIVDEEALLRALQGGQCGGAALDVYAEEPPKSQTTLELIKHPLVVATPHLGASTEEAQQRVAIEIAEQFIALAGKNKEDEDYIVNGAVNAPVLAATLEPTNLPWIHLTQKLGAVLGKLSGAGGNQTKVILTTFGEKLKGKKFLTIPALAGLLSEQAKSGVNLINAPGLAKDDGITIDYQHVDAEESLVEIAIGNKNVKGSVWSETPVLLGLNNAQISGGIPITDNITIVEGKEKIDLALLLSEISQYGGNVNGLATARGEKTGELVVLQTADALKSVKLGNNLTMY